MKRLAILYSDYTPTIDAIKARLCDYEIVCYQNINDCSDFSKFSLVILCGYKGDVEFECIDVHHSLLPAFSGDNPEVQAILAGVKITGITIFYRKSGRILAQYPVFIYNDSHFDELEQELKYLEQTLYPLVIEKILKNEPFEVRSLMKNLSTGFGCGGCHGCGDIQAAQANTQEPR